MILSIYLSITTIHINVHINLYYLLLFCGTDKKLKKRTMATRRSDGEFLEWIQNDENKSKVQNALMAYPDLISIKVWVSFTQFFFLIVFFFFHILIFVVTPIDIFF